MSDIETVVVPGNKALAELDRLRAEYPRTGLYPILFGDQEDFDRAYDELRELHEPSPEAVIEESLKLDPLEWLRKRAEDDREYYEIDQGDWPDDPGPKMDIVTHRELRSGKPKPSVVIGQLPVKAPWHVFAYLQWGGWNECPFPAEHCAMHRYWQESYGAEVVSITGDIVQCSVSRPPKDRIASLELAKEQYFYCADIVQQGTDTIEGLAAVLIDGRYWYFWWD
jgi:hypothetical protein